MRTKVIVCVTATISAVMLILVLVNVFGSFTSDGDSVGIIPTTEITSATTGTSFLFHTDIAIALMLLPQ